jgi:hypothetical protein
VIKTDVFSRICNIAETPTAEILLANLKEEFGIKECEKLIDYGSFTHSGNRHDIDIIVDDEVRSYPVQMHDNEMSFFSPCRAIWVPANTDKLKVYKVNFDWLNNAVMSALSIENMTPVCVLEEKIWFIGSARLKNRKIYTPIIFVRNITKQEVVEKLDSYLKEKHKTTPALIIAAANNIPSYYHPYGQNRIVLMNEAIDPENDNLSFNINYLADKMGGHTEQEGFSNGYRTARINNINYEFTKGQAEVMEALDKANGPMHKHEIMAETSSSQDDPKGLFRVKGKYHTAWNIVIKNDKKGNYWLDY